jgi:hypothetical protein
VTTFLTSKPCADEVSYHLSLPAVNGQGP